MSTLRTRGGRRERASGRPDPEYQHTVGEYGPPLPGGSMEGPYGDPADPPGSNRERPGREGRATGRSDRQGSDRQGSDRQGSWVTTQLAYILVVCGCVAGLAIVASDHFKRGGALIAATIFVGAVARLVLPEHRAGMLANRSRLIDVVTMTTVAVTLGFAAAWLPPPQ